MILISKKYIVTDFFAFFKKSDATKASLLLAAAKQHWAHSLQTLIEIFPPFVIKKNKIADLTKIFFGKSLHFFSLMRRKKEAAMAVVCR